jgi:Xaa-Pro aminopeptidase
MEPIGYSKEKAKKAFEKRNIDVLIATTPVNVFYCSGLPTNHVAPNPILYVLNNQFPNIVLINREGEQHLIHWMLYQSTNKFTWIKDTNAILTPKAALEGIAKKLTDWGMGSKSCNIALESLMPRYESEFIRQRFPQAQIVDGDGAFLDMRIIKSEEEIRRIKQSTMIAEKAINAMIEAVKPGITDLNLLQIARRTIVDQGAEGWDHLTMGIGDSDPEAPGTGRAMQPGDLSRFDIGAVWQGYVSDLSREVVIGSAADAANIAMDNMIKLQEYCISNVKPGVKPKDLDGLCKTWKKAQNMRGGSFITIHSIGLETEETHLMSPMISEQFPFEPNMVMDIEVWQMVSNYGLVGIEDCYRVTPSGCEPISKLPKKIFQK